MIPRGEKNAMTMMRRRWMSGWMVCNCASQVQKDMFDKIIWMFLRDFLFCERDQGVQRSREGKNFEKVLRYLRFCPLIGNSFRCKGPA